MTIYWFALTDGPSDPPRRFELDLVPVPDISNFNPVQAGNVAHTREANPSQNLLLT
jgi:hypothetical protein